MGVIIQGSHSQGSGRNFMKNNKIAYEVSWKEISWPSVISRMTKWSHRFTGRPPTYAIWAECRNVFPSLHKTAEVESLIGLLNQPCWRKHRPCLEVFQKQRAKAAQSRCAVLLEWGHGEAIYHRLGRLCKSLCAFWRRGASRQSGHHREKIPPTVASKCLSKQKEGIVS